MIASGGVEVMFDWIASKPTPAPPGARPASKRGAVWASGVVGEVRAISLISRYSFQVMLEPWWIV